MCLSKIYTPLQGHISGVTERVATLTTISDFAVNCFWEVLRWRQIVVETVSIALLSSDASQTSFLESICMNFKDERLKSHSRLTKTRDIRSKDLLIDFTTTPSR
jgi:hypothetical protein